MLTLPLLVPRQAAKGFSPASLFAGGVPGAFWDFSNLASVFTDRSATPATPATPGGPVGTIKDLSGNGNTLIAPADSQRPTLTQSGSLFYGLFDQTDDILVGQSASALNFGATNFHFYFGIRQIDNAGNFKVVFAKTDTTTGNNYRCFITNAYITSLFYGTDAESSSNSALAMVLGSDNVVAYGRDASNDLYTVNATDVTKSPAAPGVGSTSFAPRLGGDGTGTYAFGGRIYAALAIDRVLTTPEQARLKTWFGQKSGLVL